MEGFKGKEERSFLHLLCWQYRSSSLRQMVISLVLRRLTVVCETKWNETKWDETKWKSVVCEMEICSLRNENL